MCRNDIKRYIEELSHAVTTANVNFKIWWIYKKDRPKYVDAMEEYHDFFTASIHAHFVACIFALYKIYDKRADTINMRSLFKLSKADKLLSKKSEESFEIKLSNAEEVWKKVVILRSNFFAHLSAKLDYGAILKKASIKYKEIEGLVKASMDLVNEISYAYERNTYALDIDPSCDTYRLLDDLSERDRNDINETNLSNWISWNNRNKLYGLQQPGIYVIAYSDKEISSTPFSWCKEIVYIGMTNAASGLKGRLKQFDNTIRGKTGHGGADRVRYKYRNYDDLVDRLYLSVCTVECNVKSNRPNDLRNMGEVAKLEYLCFARFAAIFGNLPEFNDKKRSPKYSSTRARS